MPLRCPSPEPHRFSCNTSYSYTCACPRPRPHGGMLQPGPPGGPGKLRRCATQGRSGHSAERPSVPLRWPSPEPQRFNCNTSYTCARRPAAARGDAIAGLRRFGARPTVPNPSHRRGSRGAFKRYIAQRQRCRNGHQAVYSRCHVRNSVQARLAVGIAVVGCACARP